VDQNSVKWLVKCSWNRF